jgi:hypothetical protein
MLQSLHLEKLKLIYCLWRWMQAVFPAQTKNFFRLLLLAGRHLWLGCGRQAAFSAVMTNRLN